MLNLADNGFYLSHLLPYVKNSYINKRMTVLKISDFIMFVIDGINHAIHDFLSYNITEFDTHVGESLCQIRACYVLNIFKNHHNDKTHIDNLSTLSQELRCITERIINLKQRVGKLNKLDRLNLDVLIKTENIDTKLDCTVFYMFLCNFLTRFTIFNTLENSVVDYEKMESFSGFSKNFLRKVVHHY